MMTNASEAAELLFTTSRPTSDQIAETADLAFALRISYDEWTMDDLRAAWVLLGLSRRAHDLFLAPFVETAREFGYRWAPGESLAVLSFGSKVVRASLIRAEEVPRVASLTPSDFEGLPLHTIQAGAVFRLILPSVGIEFFAQMVAAA